ncbi:MAG TPA: ATP-binding protein [Sphingobacteriaceae bacterium]|nr:ATP-binding protein [Sphingobacteriaceae bacterium]
MKFRSLVFFNALIIGLAFGAMHYFFQQHLLKAVAVMLIAFALAFGLLYYFIERYIQGKIKLIYKMIRNLKLGKDLKAALGDKISDDPINDVEKEVIDWARAKKIEIDRLQDQEKFRREFLANISHEFKTPLFAVQGYLDALQEGMIDEDRKLAEQFLDKASKNIDRLGYLIKDLDEISKLESGRIPVSYQGFDLTRLILEVIESMEDKGKQHQVQLIFKQKYQQQTMVRADREKIRQVLVNLIDNSFKYGKSGGHTYIRIYELFEQVLVEVTDDGIGIEEKHINRVFERFFRTDKSRSRQIGGSGLGLSIVKHIIEAHAQTINVRSTEGLGSTFAFTLEKLKPK